MALKGCKEDVGQGIAVLVAILLGLLLVSIAVISFMNMILLPAHVLLRGVGSGGVISLVYHWPRKKQYHYDYVMGLIDGYIPILLFLSFGDEVGMELGRAMMMSYVVGRLGVFLLIKIYTRYLLKEPKDTKISPAR